MEVSENQANPNWRLVWMLSSGEGGGGQRRHGGPGLPTRAASASTLGPARGWSRTN